MRYRLMASYLGASYQAAVGPSDRDVTLFAAPPPPEEHGFSPVPGGGIWRKQVRLDDLDGLWESRPIGSYHGEPCLVLDDLGDRLHIVYLGMDERRAGQLGYWQVDRGVFEVVVQRHEVTDLAEERHEFPIALLLSALPRALNAGDPGAGNGGGSMPGSGSGARAGAGAGNGGIGVGRMALPSGGQGASAAGGGTSTWNGQPTTGARQLPAAQQQLQPSGTRQPASGQQLQPAGQQSMQPSAQQQSMQPGAGGQQAMSGAYQSPAGMAQNAIGAPASTRMQQPTSGPQQFGPLQTGAPVAPGTAPGQAGLPPVTDATSGLSSGAAQTPAPSHQFLGGIQSPPAQQGPPLQPGFAAQPGTGAQQFPVAAAPAAQQPTVTQQTAVSRPGDASPLPNAQPPAAVAGWHGSPVPDGNGTWYYQPNVGPQTAVGQNGGLQNPAANGPAANGIGSNGIGSNGTTPAGYASPEQSGLPPSAPSAAQPGAVTGTQQFGQTAQPSAGTGYQQTMGTGYQQPSSTAYLQAAPVQQPPSLQQPQSLPQAQSFAQSPVQAQPAQAQPPTAFGQQQFQGGAPLAQPTQFSQPAAPLTQPAPALSQPAPPPVPASATSGTLAPDPSADAGATANGGSAGLGLPLSAQAQPTAAPLAAPPLLTPSPQETLGPLPSAPAPPQPAPPPQVTAAQAAPAAAPPRSAPAAAAAAASAFGRLTGAASAVRGRRAARKPRLAMSAIFADLVDMADISRSSYAVDEEVTGAMCLFKTDGGYEVFSCAEDARHEVRFFEDEEAAYFYLFGVLAAEALRNGRLSPRRG